MATAPDAADPAWLLRRAPDESLRRRRLNVLALGCVGGSGSLAVLTVALALLLLAPTEVVRTTAGPITGVTLTDGVRAYRGVPFAQPPVGALRWRPPQPPTPWTTPRACDAAGPIAIQTGTAKLARERETQSEDCLYLNVWTAAAPGAQRPVMVWIHGGGFKDGSGSKDTYDGTQLARLGAVVVTINYRLGVLGYFAHPELSAETPGGTSGNQGFRDQIAALTWVRDNIAALGGDPGCVTLFGESAGAVSVATLLASPLARGLFHRAVMESGGPTPGLRSLKQSTPLLPSAESLGVALARRAGAATLADLRRLSPEQLLAALPPEAKADNPGAGPQQYLCVDGAVLTEPTADAFAQGHLAPVPILLGTNADEGTLWAMGQWTVAGYQARARAQAGPFADRILQLYPAHTDQEAKAAFAAVLGDSFHALARRAARDAAQAGRKVYKYVLLHRTRRYDLLGLGAFHGSEVPYVFGNYGQIGGYNEADHKLGDTMAGYWYRFAASGDPNGGGAPAWASYDPATDNYLALDIPVAMRQGWRSQQLDLLDQLGATRRPAAP